MSFTRKIIDNTKHLIISLYTTWSLSINATETIQLLIFQTNDNIDSRGLSLVFLWKKLVSKVNFKYKKIYKFGKIVSNEMEDVKWMINY